MQFENSNRFVKFNKAIAYVLIIIFLSVACGLAAISGSHSFTNTYDSGKVCDTTIGTGYNVLSPGTDDSYFWISTSDEPFAWNYIYMDIKDANFDKASLEIQGYDENKQVGRPMVREIEEGYNEIKIDGDECSSFKVSLSDDESISFTVKFIELRESKWFFSMSKYLRYVGAFIIAFVLISGTVILILRRKKLKIDWYGPIDFLQDIYLSFGNRFVTLSLKVTRKEKSALRIAALIFWMFWIMFIYNTGKYMLTAYFKYNVAIFCVLMLLIAVSMIEKPLEKKDWNRPVVHAWLWLSICMCVSEFFISKRFCMIGYVNLTVLGFYYFTWDNLTDKAKVITEIITAFKIAFLISVCFTLLCRPRGELGGLVGHTWNPNIYGIFCAIVLMGFLASIRNHIINRNYRLVFAADMVGSMVSLSFVLLAGSRAGFILAVPGLIFFLAEYVSMITSGAVKPVKGILSAVAIVVMFYCIHILCAWATVNLPIVQVVFSWDSQPPNEAMQAIISIGMEAPSIQRIAFDERVTSFLTARNLYWMEYLREINFFGHEYYPIIWGGARYPHNGILGIIYRYGILTAVPYIIMFINVCVISFKRYLRERKETSPAFYFWICAIGISLCMLVENFERPFLATEWLWWYWCLGAVFIKKDNEGDLRREE